MDSMAGSEQTVPAHATVMILSLSPNRPQLTITAGTGYSIFPGFQCCFAMLSPFLELHTIFLKQLSCTLHGIHTRRILNRCKFVFSDYLIHKAAVKHMNHIKYKAFILVTIRSLRLHRLSCLIQIRNLLFHNM